MIYTITKSVPANTHLAEAKQYKMPLTNGLIYQVEFYFPPGSSGLLGIQVKDGGYQVWPSEPGEWFFGDNTLIKFDDKYYVSSPARVLDIYAYNEDDAYAHRFQIRVGQANDPAIIASYIPLHSEKSLEQIIAELVVNQNITKEEQQTALIDYFSAPEET